MMMAAAPIRRRRRAEPGNPDNRRRPDEKAHKTGLPSKPRLKADKGAGRIGIASEATRSCIPPEAWDNRLGNGRALQRIPDRHKANTQKDPTIRDKFRTCRFADCKDRVIDLRARVTTFGLETTRAVAAEKQAVR